MPRITDVSPRNVPASAGMDLTIRGEGFGSDKSKLAVHIGETPAVVRRVKNGNIIARLPDVEDLRAGVASWRGERRDDDIAQKSLPEGPEGSEGCATPPTPLSQDDS